MTYVTCRLTAKNRDQLRNPTLGIKYGIPLASRSSYFFTGFTIKQSQQQQQQQPFSDHLSSGVVSGTTVRALVLGCFSQKKLKIELKNNAKK